MGPGSHETKRRSDDDAFLKVFRHSRIPMALVDETRRYVDANDAAVEFYKFPRDELIGAVAGRTSRTDPAMVEARWEELVRTGELYGESVITDATGTPLRICYAAHVTRMAGPWLALFVVLSTAPEPEGPELLDVAGASADRDGQRAPLTAREREVVQMVALGAGTQRIADSLGVSRETVRSHIRNAMSKTDSHTRAQLVAIALATGLIEDRD